MEIRILYRNRPVSLLEGAGALGTGLVGAAADLAGAGAAGFAGAARPARPGG